MQSPDIASRRAAFRRLHQSGCFVIPNPWDIGSARYLRGLGFKALATTSGGFAFSRGLSDGAVSLDMMLSHISEIVASVDLPVNADFERGFADDPEAVANNVGLCIKTGVAGLSIEDATGNGGHPLYDLPLAVDRIRAARASIDASEGDVPGSRVTRTAEYLASGISPTGNEPSVKISLTVPWRSSKGDGCPALR